MDSSHECSVSCYIDSHRGVTAITLGVFTFDGVLSVLYDSVVDVFVD